MYYTFVFVPYRAMKLPYNLFVACFFYLTLSLATGSANATEQVNDNFDYKGKTYSLTGKRIPLDLSKWGLRPEGFTTGCYRGYMASFILVGDKLVLIDLVANNGFMHDTAPEINGVTPKKYKREERWSGFFVGDLEYKNIFLPLDYTGSAILKDGRIIGGMHGRFDDAAGYKTAIELTFENGILKSEKDISQEMAEIRKRTEQIRAMGENVEVIKDLIAEGVDVNMESYDGTTPLHVAIEKENLPIVEFLISKGADVHVLRDWHNGNTLLHWAAGKENLDIVKLLVSKGLDVNAKDKGDYTPLHTAARNPNATIAEFLVAQGADVNAKCSNSYSTPLHAASFYGNNVEVAKFFVERGADVNAKDNDDNTPLHLAVRYGSNADVVRFLLSQGADVSVKNQQGETPLDKSHSEYTKYLSGQ